MATILVIDDDESLREVLVTVLTQDHHQVIVARSGTDIHDCIGRGAIDLIVTGVLMERDHGIEIIRALAGTDGGVSVIALPGGLGLMSTDFTRESAAVLGIKIIPVRNFVRTALRQAVGQALSSGTPANPGVPRQAGLPGFPRSRTAFA